MEKALSSHKKSVIIGGAFLATIGIIYTWMVISQAGFLITFAENKLPPCSYLTAYGVEEYSYLPTKQDICPLVLKTEDEPVGIIGGGACDCCGNRC